MTRKTMADMRMSTFTLFCVKRYIFVRLKLRLMTKAYFNQQADIWDEKIAEKDVCKLEHIAVA